MIRPFEGSIADTGKDGETKFLLRSASSGPRDKDGSIIYPSWWKDEQETANSGNRKQQRGAAKKDVVVIGAGKIGAIVVNAINVTISSLLVVGVLPE